MSRLARILMKRRVVPRDVSPEDLMAALMLSGPATARDLARRNRGTTELQWMRAAKPLYDAKRISTENVPCHYVPGPAQHLLFRFI